LIKINGNIEEYRRLDKEYKLVGTIKWALIVRKEVQNDGFRNSYAGA
jgi:hypothetical protein